MKTIKTFTEHKNNQLNEYYGGTLIDLMGPRIDGMINFLVQYKEKISSPDAILPMEDAELSKVSKMYDIFTLSK